MICDEAHFLVLKGHVYDWIHEKIDQSFLIASRGRIMNCETGATCTQTARRYDGTEYGGQVIINQVPLLFRL